MNVVTQGPATLIQIDLDRQGTVRWTENEWEALKQKKMQYNQVEKVVGLDSLMYGQSAFD